ncbi:ABC transporter substrate-binding protein [Colwelliaceae bacterium 6441]
MNVTAKIITPFLLFVSLSSFASTEIDIYTWRSQEKSLWNAINERKLIPNIKVNVKSLKYESYVPHVTLNLQNNTVDIFQWAPGASSLKPLIEHKFITPFDGDLSLINTSALLASKGPDNQYYGVPFALQLQSVLVNKKLLNKYNINQQPKNLSELENIFSMLKSKGVTPLHLAGNENWYLNQLVAEVLLAGLVDESFAQQLTEGKACFTEPEYMQTLELLNQWMKKGYLNSNTATENYGGMATSVALGNSAMAIDGGWRTNPASTFFSIDPDFEFYFWPIPGKVNKVYALGDGSYQVNANSKKADLAREVLQFTSTKQFAELFAQYVGELPAYGGEINIANPVLKAMSDKVTSAYQVSLFNSLNLNKQEPSYRSLIMSGLKDLFNQRKSAKQISQDIQTGLNSWNYLGSNQCQ